jgi:hypothetical protein
MTATEWQFNDQNVTSIIDERERAQAICVEACRCIDFVINKTDLPLKDMAGAVQDVARHFSVRRGHRWGILHALLDRFEGYPVVFWTLLFHAWEDAESDCLRRVPAKMKRAIWFDFNRMPHEYMSPENKAFFKSLPKIVTIYRGTQRPGRHVGVCWTTDKAMAEWFARRNGHCGKPVLMTGRVRKRNIIACIVDRDESEVLVFPKHVRGRKEEALS